MTMPEEIMQNSICADQDMFFPEWGDQERDGFDTKLSQLYEQDEIADCAKNIGMIPAGVFV
jgi:hypothetical protein